jgi:hypothetical protein
MDHPGALHHLTNRGAAHRPLFETQTDVQAFCARVERSVVEGEIELLAMCVMSTHFHVLVRSLRGELSTALHRSESTFAGWYNRTRERDGPAFKGRYFDRPVYDAYQAANCVAYIDRNPVSAGMVASPEQYPHGTARYYCGDRSPVWLNREYVEQLVCRITGARRYSPVLYPSLWAACSPELSRALVERSLGNGRVRVTSIRVLVNSGPEATQRWLRDLTMVEEGRSKPCLALPGEEVLRVCGGANTTGRDTRHMTPTQEAVWDLCVGLLHLTAGWPTREIASTLGATQSRVARALARHRERMREDSAYAMDAGRRLSDAVRRVFGPLANLA